MFKVWALSLWLAPGAGLVVLLLVTEWSSGRHRPWKRQLLRVFATVAVVGPLLLFTWPLLLAATLWQIRRDWWRDRILYGPALPADRLTPEQWRRGTHPARLLAALHKQLTPRQQRRIAWACCRRMGRHLDHPTLRRALERSERTPDGLPPLPEHAVLVWELESLVSVAMDTGDLRRAAAARACLCALAGDAAGAADAALVASGRWGWSERAEQMRLVRDILGDPFAPLLLRAVPRELQELARAIDAGDHALYPLLADALDEMGEPDAARHCREGKHWRGCHVIERLLPLGERAVTA